MNYATKSLLSGFLSWSWLLLLPYNLTLAEPKYTLPLQTVEPDQLASAEASWSGSALFAIKFVN